MGWHLYTLKKTLPNGEKVFIYNNQDRKHGWKIFILGITGLIFWMIILLLIWNEELH